MALSWNLKLTDNVSGPARKAGGSLDELARRLEKVRKVAKRDGIAGGAERALMGEVRSVSKLTQAYRALAAAKGRASKAAGAALEMAWPAIGGAALAGGAAGIAGAFKLGTMVQDSQAFRNNTLFAFETILKSKSAAADAYAMATKTAIDTGQDFRESMGAMNRLLVAGFDTRSADNLVRTMADLKAVNPRANLDGITTAISQIKSTGTLQGDELMQLAEHGLSIDAVYSQLEKSMGKSRAEIIKMKEAGRITSGAAISAIEAAIAQTTGAKNPGDVAAKRAETSLIAAFNRAKTAGEQFLADLDVDFSPLNRGLEKVIALLKSPAGEKFAAQLEKSMNAAIAVLDNIDANELEATLEGVTSVLKSMHSAASDTMRTISGLVDLYQRANAAFMDVSGVSILDAALWAVNGTTAVTQAMLVDLPTAVLDAWAGLGEGIMGLVDEASAAATTLGNAVTDGLVAGIEAGAGSAVGALSGIVGQALAAGHERARTGSPSKETELLGKYMGQGLSVGMVKEVPRVERASVQMSSAPLEAGRRIGSLVNNSSTSTRNDNSRRTHIEHLHVQDSLSAILADAEKAA